MDSFLHDDGSELSEIELEELEELITTKFVAQKEEWGQDNYHPEIEMARAVGSPIQLSLSPILAPLRRSDEFLLEDHPSLLRPIQERVHSDNAVALLHRILDSPESVLKKFPMWNIFEKSRKWKNTTRVSELALVNTIICNVNHRPTHLHVFCRRLIESDISNIIGKSLLGVDPPTKTHSLFRITVKTEMPLKQFIGQLNALTNEFPNIHSIDKWTVNATKKNLDGSNQKLNTTEIEPFCQLEHIMTTPSIQPIVASARIWFQNMEKPFVTVNIGYHNELNINGRRCKTIVIEQIVDPLHGTVPKRRVTFGNPVLVETVHFEIDDGLPFFPLRFPNKINDLIHYLASQEPKDTFKNITFR